MAVVNFSDYFWGEKNEGFNTLYQNMKCGALATKDLADFFRECAKAEEENSKIQLKILKQVNATSSTGGTFAPLMSAFKPAAEKLALIHHEWMSKLNDLVKEVVKYGEEVHKRHKTVKEEESTTLEVVKTIQETTALLQKAKELYKQKCLEVEKLKRDNASVKDLEKAEAKFRKAQDEYKVLVDKYCVVREEFEKRMTASSKKFQDIETLHLIQMREYVETYCQIVITSHTNIGEVNFELQNQLNSLTVEKLLEQFAQSRYTGLEKPGPIEFDEEKLSVTSIPGEPYSDVSDRSANSDKLSLGSFKKQDVSISSGSNATAAASVVATSSSTPAPNVSSSGGSGKREGRMRTWSVARARKKKELSNSNLSPNQTTTSSRASRATSLLNLFVSNDKNSSPLPPPPSTTECSNGDAGGTLVDVNAASSSAPNTPTGVELELSRSVQSRGSKCGNLSSSPIPSVSSVDNDQSLRDDSNVPSCDEQSKTASSSGWTVSGFLRRRKDKKKKGEKDPNESGEISSQKMGSDGEDPRKSETPTPEVDDEGFSKPPDRRNSSDPWDDFNQTKNNFYSSSDESDDEMKRKIKVEIKPVSNTNAPISASVDELRSAIGGLELNPPPSKLRPASALNERIPMSLKKFRESSEPPTSANEIRRSQSQSHLVHKPSQDLLGLSLHPIDNIDNVKTTSTPNAKTSETSKMDVSDISVSSNTSKEVKDIFSDLSLLSQPSLPPKQQRPSSVQREKISNSLIALPRPPSRHGYGQPATLSRRNYHASLQNSSTESPKSADQRFGTSRGPSPLSLSMSDTVPLAVAFQEVAHACFRGVDESQCQVRLIGDMMISFPAGIIQMITTNPLTAPLLFRIKNASVLESIVPNKQLINPSPTLSNEGEVAFEFNMKNLKELLKYQAEQSPSASYFNIDILKYQIRSREGAKSCPLQLVAYWKCEQDHTDLRLNYKYNASAMAGPSPLLNLSIAVPIDGGVTKMTSQPDGVWIAENNRALWKFKELGGERDSQLNLRSLRGRFELSNGPGSQGTIAAQFNCEGSTLSGVDFELIGPGYRLSLIKKRFVSGKYICDADADNNRYRYAVPPPATSSDC